MTARLTLTLAEACALSKATQGYIPDSDEWSERESEALEQALRKLKDATTRAALKVGKP